MSGAIIVRGRIAEHLRREAEKLGASIDEFLVELLSQSLDPKDRAVEYVEAAEELLEQAREELGKGDVKQAAEKLWGARSFNDKGLSLLEGGEKNLQPW